MFRCNSLPPCDVLNTLNFYHDYTDIRIEREGVIYKDSGEHDCILVEENLFDCLHLLLIQSDLAVMCFENKQQAGFQTVPFFSALLRSTKCRHPVFRFASLGHVTVL